LSAGGLKRQDLERKKLALPLSDYFTSWHMHLSIAICFPANMIRAAPRKSPRLYGFFP
jgi:hypothetical protein